MVRNITPWNTISIVMKPGYMESSSTVNAATLFFWTMFLKPSLCHTFLFTFYMTILKHTGHTYKSAVLGVQYICDIYQVHKRITQMVVK